MVALGPLTNLALAFKIDPSIAPKIKEIFIMGGNMEGLGNASMGAEFNFYSDAEAAYIVLQAVKCPTYIATWELCLLKSRLEMVSLIFLCLLRKLVSGDANECLDLLPCAAPKPLLCCLPRLEHLSNSCFQDQHLRSSANSIQITIL